MKLVAQSAFVVVMLLVAAPVVQACFCMAPGVGEGFDRADMVFVGEVLEIIPPRSTDVNALFGDRGRTIRFKVEMTWKGLLWPEVNVLAPVNSCFTIYPARPGEKYLVYAVRVASGSIADVQIDPCNRTTKLNTTDDVRILNNIIMISRPRPRPASLPWLSFLEP